MLILQCCPRVISRHGLAAGGNAGASSGRLGDWCATESKARHASLTVFVNPASRLTLLTPTLEIGDLLLAFKARLVALLASLEVRDALVTTELDRMATVEFENLVHPELIEEMLARVGHACSEVRGVDSAVLGRWQREWAVREESALGGRSPVEVVRELLASRPVMH